MEKRKVKIKLNVAVYLILGLLSLILFAISSYIELTDSWKDVTFSLAVELLGVVIVFLIAQYFFIWDDESEKRNEKLDIFLSKIQQEQYSTVFVTEKAGMYNDKFYEHFNDTIRLSKHNIYISGEGFDSEGGKLLAIDFIDANLAALANGVNIVRLQTTSEISEYWSVHLKKLLEFPNFKLFVADPTWTIGSICSIDDFDEINNISEYMLSVPRTSGIKGANLAGLAVFIEKKQQLATDIKKMILDHISSSSLEEINLDNFEQIMKIKN